MLCRWHWLKKLHVYKVRIIPKKIQLSMCCSSQDYNVEVHSSMDGQRWQPETNPKIELKQNKTNKQTILISILTVWRVPFTSSPWTRIKYIWIYVWYWTIPNTTMMYTWSQNDTNIVGSEHRFSRGCTFHNTYENT